MISLLGFVLVSVTSFAAGPNETLFTILNASGFGAESVGTVNTITVQNVYCEEKSSKKVKCTAMQSGQMLEISDDRLFLQALRGQSMKFRYLELAKKYIYTLKELECSSRASTTGGVPFYSCTATP